MNTPTFHRPLLVFSLFVLTVALIADATWGQRGGRQRGGRGPNAGPGGRQGGRQGGGDMISLLRRQDVQKELDLTDDQLKDLEELSQNRRGGDRGGRDLRSELEGLSEEERREKFQELRDERQGEMEADVKKILVSSQFNRLKELSVQFRSQRGGTGGLNRQLIEELGISEDQLEDLEAKAKELQDEFEKEVAKLRAEMKEDLLKELTPSQRDKYKQLTGDAFEFEQQRPERPDGAGGARQRPGRGGQPGRQGKQGGRQRGGDQGGESDF